MSPLRPLAIIYGVGPGLGLSLAKAFAPTHSLAILSRTLSNLEPLVNELEKEGGDVKAFASDHSEASLKDAFERIQKEFGGREVDVGLWNGSARPSPKPFLESTSAEFEESVGTGILGPAAFSRLLLPLLLSKPLSTTSPLQARGSLIFTGATASRKGSAKFGAFAVGKFGLAALAQSLAREFGPEGVHVAHVVLDGVLGKDSEKRINPDSIAPSFIYLHNQDRTALTFELDLRPASESF